MSLEPLAALLVAAVLFFWATGAHNRLVTLRNATSSSIDTGLIGHDASAGGAEAPRVYDPANDIPAPGQNPGALAPGQVRSYRVAFAHQPGQSLAVRTAYGWDGQVIHT